jgi:hypothetical protein
VVLEGWKKRLVLVDVVFEVVEVVEVVVGVGVG